MIIAKVVKKSVTVNSNSPIQDYVHQDDHNEMTPGFTPFTVLNGMNGRKLNNVVRLSSIQTESCPSYNIPSGGSIA